MIEDGEVWLTGWSGGIGKAIQNYISETNYISDVKDDEQINSELKNATGTLIYCAGINYLEWSDKIDCDKMLEVYNVNVVGLIRCLKAGAFKRCIVIGSDVASRPMRTSVAYNSSKAALEAAVKCIARERAGEGFVINIVAPGVVEDTNMTNYVFERTRELRPDLDLNKYMKDSIPAGKFASVDDVAEVVRWLVYEAPDYLNGSIITVNGGR